MITPPSLLLATGGFNSALLPCPPPSLPFLLVAQAVGQDILDIPPLGRLDLATHAQVVKATERLLTDSGIQTCIDRSREYYLPDAAP